MKFYAKFIAVALLLIGIGFVAYPLGYKHGYADGFESRWSVSLEQFEEAIGIARKLEQERRRAGTFEGRK